MLFPLFKLVWLRGFPWGSRMRRLRTQDGQERHHESREHPLSVHGMRGEPGAQDRQCRKAPRKLPVLAAFTQATARHAGQGEDLQEKDEALLADMAHAAQDRASQKGRLRRRAAPRKKGGGAHRLRRRACFGVASREIRELPRLGIIAGSHSRPRGRGVRRRGRLRQSAQEDMARHAAPALRLPCLLAGEALYHHETEDPGGRGALWPRKGSFKHHHLERGAGVGRCPSDVV